ncbi:MAG TPA: DUF6687 family protein [Nitrospiria bacterium]|jgi:hypothetical protein
MKFIYYSPEILSETKISVDGIVPNSFHLSHWKGNQTPEVFTADTSTEIAIKFITHPHSEKYIQKCDILSNNHFDTDGLLALWVLLSPSQALPHKEFLIAAAEVGDFSQFTQPKAVQFNLLVTAFRESPESPFAETMREWRDEKKDQFCYEKLLEQLPLLLSNLSAYEKFWLSEYIKIENSFEQFEKGEVLRKEFPKESLTVLVCGKRPSKYAIDHHCQGNLFLIVQIHSEGFCYDLEYRYYSWAETITRPKIPQVPMEQLASRLNVYDGRGLGRWMSQGFQGGSLTTALKYTNPEGDSLPSRFPYENVAQMVRDYIRQASAGQRSHPCQ